MCAFQNNFFFSPKDIFNTILDLGCDFNISFVSQINTIFAVTAKSPQALY